MKLVLVFFLTATALSLAACAHSGEMAFSPPSALSVAQINAELAVISAEKRSLAQGRTYLGETPTSPAPIVLHVSDSNGVPLTTPIPEVGRVYPAVPTTSRPWGYARSEILNKRRAALYAELMQRGSTQR